MSRGQTAKGLINPVRGLVLIRKALGSSEGLKQDNDRMCAQPLHSCQTLGDPVDCRRPGSSVRGILQARILEWVAVPSSRGSS